MLYGHGLTALKTIYLCTPFCCQQLDYPRFLAALPLRTGFFSDIYMCMLCFVHSLFHSYYMDVKFSMTCLMRFVSISMVTPITNWSFYRYTCSTICYFVLFWQHKTPTPSPPIKNVHVYLKVRMKIIIYSIQPFRLSQVLCTQ